MQLGPSAAGPEWVITDAASMRAFSRERRARNQKVAFVPTMGSLHEGHLSLVRHAKARAPIVVVSIYVNPTQFAPSEDFEEYPRQTKEDLRKLKEEGGVSAVFMPKDLYAPRNNRDSGTESSESEAEDDDDDTAAASTSDHQTWVSACKLERPLCGKTRPKFFRGVATVVCKLFNIVEPDVALFGEKDYQQLRVIQTMARELDFAVEVVGCPIFRVADGLAMSSRNALLAEGERKKALGISEALSAAAEAVEGLNEGDEVGAHVLCNLVRSTVEKYGGRVDYVDMVDERTLRRAKRVGKAKRSLIAVAAFYRSKHEGQEVRLIDNKVLGGMDGAGGEGSPGEARLLKRRVRDLERENADLERENAELRAKLESRPFGMHKYKAARKSIKDEPEISAKKNTGARKSGFWSVARPSEGTHVGRRMSVLYDQPRQWFTCEVIKESPQGVLTVRYDADGVEDEIDMNKPDFKSTCKFL